MLRQASRVDGNQADIVRQLRGIGASILHCHFLKNAFDLLVGYRGRTFIMEIKYPNQPPSARKLTPGEAKFRDEWKGSEYHVVHTFDEALAILTARPGPATCPHCQGKL